jgi:hypothetical protein
MKRANAPDVVENPFVKRQNKSWTVGPPGSLTARVSPPRSRRTTKSAAHDETPTNDLIERTVTEANSKAKTTEELARNDGPTTASVESGEVDLEDPVSFFSAKLLQAARPHVPDVPRLSHKDWLDIYNRNQNPQGRHFVIHQHDHPLAGTHYDLRLQCNGTSSISWACMYGLPGDPNSRRLNRNATETRVHNLWVGQLNSPRSQLFSVFSADIYSPICKNHLIETASHSTGTMLIWDTGEYSVLPYRDSPIESDVESGSEEGGSSTLTDSDRLHQAFQKRKIRLRLHGTRLPAGYTLAIRADKDYFPTEQPKKPARKRRRKNSKAPSQQILETSSSATSDIDEPQLRRKHIESLHRTASPPRKLETAEDGHAASEEESEAIRLTNAYTGATNDIGSVHQRKWYLSMDRASSGFVPARDRKTGIKTWIRKRGLDGTLRGFKKFWVMGRDVEPSVVTGRLAKDIMKDEGVEGYVPRGLWRPVTE